MLNASEHVVCLRGHRIYGRMYEPVGNENGPGILLLNSLFTEANYSRTFLMNMGRFFCNAGYRTLYLDYVGQGESEGQSSMIRLDTLHDDVQAGIEHLSDLGGKKVVVIGFRGGAVPAMAHAANSAVALTVLWEPVTAGAELVRFRRLATSVRDHHGEDDRIDIGGWRISRVFFDELKHWHIDYAKLPVQSDRLLIVRFAESARNCEPAREDGYEVVVHVSSRKFWYLGYRGYCDYTNQAAEITHAFIQRRVGT